MDKILNATLFVVLAIVLTVHSAWAKAVPVLPDPAPSDVVNVSTVAELTNAVNNAREGQTILIADGTYDLSVNGGWGLEIRTSNLTLRGASDDPTKVTLLGQGFETNSGELIILLDQITDFTLAYLTVRDVGTNGLKIQSGSNNNVLVHNVYFIDICERAIKGPGVAISSNWEVRYCLFEQTKALTEAINPYAGGNYIGGIDVVTAVNWHIHDNVFKNIKGEDGGGRGAIYLKQNSTNIIVERNTFIGCDRSICFGNPSEGPVDVLDSIIRNNFIYACASQAIELDHSSNIKIYNNSMYQMDNVINSNTIWIMESSDLDFKNNIIFSKDPVITDPGYDTSANLWYQNNSALAGDFFVDYANGDFHLKATATAAIDQAEVLADVTDDWDMESRGGIMPDMGADERDLGSNTDTDSIPDDWELYFFGNLTTADDTTDNDGDGASDLLEFLAGGDADTPANSVYNPTLSDFTADTDSDIDGMPDIWEYSYFSNLNETGESDYDSDGLSNNEEYEAHTNPLDADTDNDGLLDGEDFDPLVGKSNTEMQCSLLQQRYSNGLLPFLFMFACSVIGFSRRFINGKMSQ